MIKENDYKKKTECARIDAAMLALGFAWDGDSAYVPTESKAKKPVQAAVIERRIVKRKARRLASSPGFYNGLMTLGVGETADITAEMALLHVTRNQMRNRIYQYTYSAGKNRTFHFTLELKNGRYLVTRV